jgi:hypothetical protein
MKPSSALTLQLMEYTKKVGGDASSSGSGRLRRWRQWVGLATQNWIPLTIYFLLLMIVAKCVYETAVGMLSDNDDDDGELVCK